MAFIWSSKHGWCLAWWASDEASFITGWFRRHAPAPERFLGYTPPTLRLLEPYMPELPGVESPGPPYEVPGVSAGGTISDDADAPSGDEEAD